MFFVVFLAEGEGVLLLSEGCEVFYLKWVAGVVVCYGRAWFFLITRSPGTALPRPIGGVGTVVVLFRSSVEREKKELLL